MWKSRLANIESTKQTNRENTAKSISDEEDLVQKKYDYHKDVVEGKRKFRTAVKDFSGKGDVRSIYVYLKIFKTENNTDYNQFGQVGLTLQEYSEFLANRSKIDKVLDAMTSDVTTKVGTKRCSEGDATDVLTLKKRNKESSDETQSD